MTLDNTDPFFVTLDDYADLVDEYEQAKQAQDAAEAEVARLREMLVKVLPVESEAPDGSIGTVGGNARVSYRPHVRRNLDHHKLRDLYPSVVSVCTDYATQWTLRTIPPVKP